MRILGKNYGYLWLLRLLARARRILRSREDSAAVVKEAALHCYYASHNWNPYFLQGIKTITFKIWEQLGWEVSDNIVVPAGQGSLVL